MSDTNTQPSLERKVLAPVEQPAIVFQDGTVMRKAVDGNYTIKPKESYFGPRMEKALKIATGIFITSGIVALCIGEHSDAFFIGVGGAATYICYRFGRNEYNQVFSQKERSKWIVVEDKTPFAVWNFERELITDEVRNYATKHRN